MPRPTRSSERENFSMSGCAADRKAMIPDRTDAARDLLAFYSEFGVDAVLNEKPTDRFAATETPVIARKVAVATADVEVASAGHALAPPAPDEAAMAARDAAP